MALTLTCSNLENENASTIARSDLASYPVASASTGGMPATAATHFPCRYIHGSDSAFPPFLGIAVEPPTRSTPRSPSPIKAWYPRATGAVERGAGEAVGLVAATAVGLVAWDAAGLADEGEPPLHATKS